MGLDIDVSLIVGVPLDQIGAVEEEVERRQTTDGLGKPTGRSVTLKSIYLRTPNDLRFLIGSNKRGALNGYPDRIEYHFGVPWRANEDESDEDNNWIHASDWEQADMSAFIIGLHVDSEIDSECNDRYAGFEGAQMANIQLAINVVREELSQRLGYVGKIYVIALASYSY